MIEKSGLVRLLDVDEDFIIELIYATNKNFTEKVVYLSNECYINKDTAKLLVLAKNMFKTDGFGLKILDAYRPISAQKRLFEIHPDTDFVAPLPDMGTITSFRPTHLNGMCVDVTLVDSYGKDIEMPSKIDDFSGKANLFHPDVSVKAKSNALYLKRIMESVGFFGYEHEWWHFYDIITVPTPFLDFQI